MPLKKVPDIEAQKISQCVKVPLNQLEIEEIINSLTDYLYSSNWRYKEKLIKKLYFHLNNMELLLDVEKNQKVR